MEKTKLREYLIHNKINWVINKETEKKHNNNLVGEKRIMNHNILKLK